jgi:hypothetical protein
MEKTNVKHYVITRFNVPNQTGINLQKDWVSDRVRLLRSYSIPSIKSQSRKTFTWLIFVDDKTPPSWINRLTDIVRESIGDIQFRVCLINEKFSSDLLSSAVIGMSMDEWPTHVITTLLDVDDCISSDYLKSVESLFLVSKYVKSFIAPTNGVCFSEETGHFLSDCNIHPAVVSFCEQYITSHTCYTQQLTTCLKSRNLRELQNYGKRLKSKFASCWLKVFHKNNSLARIFPDGIQVDSKIIQDRFSNISDFD